MTTHAVEPTREETRGTDPDPDPALGHRLAAILAVGAVFLLLAVPSGITTLATRYGIPSLGDVGAAAGSLTASWDPGLFLPLLGYGLLLYLALLTAMAVRHDDALLLVRGAGSLILATAALHVIAWLAVIAVAVVVLVARVLGAAGTFVTDHVGSPVGHASVEGFGLLADAFVPLLGGYSPAGAALAVLLVVGSVVAVAVRGAGRARTAARIVLLTVAAVAALLLLIPALALVLPYVLPVLGVAVAVVGVVVFVVAAGYLLVDQVRSSRFAGSGSRGVVMGGVAVGTAISVLLLQTGLFGAYDWLPGPVALFATDVVVQRQPGFGIAVALAITVLCCVGVSRGLVRRLDEPGPEEFRRSLLIAAVGTAATAVVAAVGRYAARHPDEPFARWAIVDDDRG